MKIRTMFVTNSSSSSYICEICDNIESGYDGPSDVGFAVCEKDHEFCSYHLDDMNDTVKRLKLALEKNEKDLINYIETSSSEYNLKDIKNNLNNDSKLLEIIEDIIDQHYDNHIPFFLCPICSFDYPDLYTIPDYLSKFSVPTKNQFSEQLIKINPNTKLINEKYVEQYLINNNLNMNLFLQELKKEYSYSFNLPR